MRHDRLLAAAFAVAVSTPMAGASPLNWPDDGGQDLALHCGAVLQAYGHAYEFAADLAGRDDALPIAGLPVPLILEAGGDARLPDIAARAEGFLPHAESVARTSFYPHLVGDGTPYLADDGRELVMAVQVCADRFGLG
ncbi:hypothetical protein [Hasllibacter sp. MH4015]|uniref:hypothetical protein n=1 Tax=Hasllibacter sp. MH4015 TaxID=2854029 RepID=UPI001CD72A77|nr:hypothetical protein [Hasllibacter sp. MH4015]